LTGSPGRGAALAGGLAALAATILLPFHLGGTLGTAIAALFLIGGLLLALASLRLGSALSRRVPAARLWGWAGAIGFIVSGAALVGDVVERPFVVAEIAAVAVVAFWWLAVGSGFRGRARFALFSILCAASAAGAILGHFVWEPPAGAVPVRFAYVLWGPWGLWLAAAWRRA
jgi:hypothetical protein